MLQIFIISYFISLKIPHYAHYYSFYAPHCYYYSIVPIANDTMHKCCNGKLQVVHDNSIHIIINYKVSMCIVL